MVIKVVANIPNEDISVGEKKTESEPIRDVLIALVQSVKKLHLNGKDVSYPSNTSYKKEVSFQMPNANRKEENKLHTLGKVTLAFGYGETLVVLVLGWDAIQKHAFRLDGETKSIYLARDEQVPSAISRAPEMVVTSSDVALRIPRNTKLDIIEIIHLVIGKISLDQPEARPNETIKSIVISEVNPEFQAPPSKIRTKFIQKDDAQFDSAHIEQLTTKGNY
ncbi:hypothetical protein OUZ56_005618 [Daphnia magna]|uniref:Uncharacterized protein n=1 Tax=Daphnia magna TaxID=35525 RepID=A0ABQ9YT98_9CRUS|nr:hypothetical protein OUZ56_005618 [Daphnia magna]